MINRLRYWLADKALTAFSRLLPPPDAGCYHCVVHIIADPSRVSHNDTRQIGLATQAYVYNRIRTRSIQTLYRETPAAQKLHEILHEILHELRETGGL